MRPQRNGRRSRPYLAADQTRLGTENTAQVTYTTSEADAWQTLTNAETLAEVNLINSQDSARSTYLTSEYGNEQTGADLGLQPVNLSQSFDPNAPVLSAYSTSTTVNTATVVSTAKPSEQTDPPAVTLPIGIEDTQSPEAAPVLNSQVFDSSSTNAETDSSYLTGEVMPEGGDRFGNHNTTDTTPINVEDEATNAKTDGYDPNPALTEPNAQKADAFNPQTALAYAEVGNFSNGARAGLSALDQNRRFANGDIQANELHPNVLQFAMQYPAVWKELVKSYGQNTIRLFSIVSAWGWNFKLQPEGWVAGNVFKQGLDREDWIGNFNIDSSSMTATIGMKTAFYFGVLQIKQRSAKEIADSLYAAILTIYTDIGKPTKLPSTLSTAEQQNASGVPYYAAWDQATAFRQEFLADLARELKIQAAFAGGGVVLSNLDNLADLGFAAARATKKAFQTRYSPLALFKRFAKVTAMRGRAGGSVIPENLLREWMLDLVQNRVDLVRNADKAIDAVNPKDGAQFIARKNGWATIRLRKDATILEFSHEVYHLQHFEEIGRDLEKWNNLTRFEKEYYVYKKIKEDGLWELLTDAEKELTYNNVWNRDIIP